MKQAIGFYNTHLSIYAFPLYQKAIKKSFWKKGI